MSIEKKYDIVIPILSKDFEKFELNVACFREYLSPRRFILLGDEGLKERINRLDSDDIVYINENEILEAKRVKAIFEERIAKGEFGEKSPLRRFGWYYQQFLKLDYAYYCEDDYYIVWDADTLPIKEYHAFSTEAKPFFDVKEEYHIPYFDTLRRLSDNKLKKEYDFSFISEHMVLKCDYVKEMISAFSGNTNDFYDFCRRVFECIDDINLGNSGFSEFETYGSYCMAYHKEAYVIRHWSSLRDANKYFDHLNFNKEDMSWLGDRYDAVSFEKFIEPNRIYRRICSKQKIRLKYTFEEAAAIAKRKDRILGAPGRFCKRVINRLKRK